MFWDTSREEAPGGGGVDLTEVEWTLRSHVDSSIRALREEMQKELKDALHTAKVEHTVRLEELQRTLEMRWLPHMGLPMKGSLADRSLTREARSSLMDTEHGGSQVPGRNSMSEADFGWVVSGRSTDNFKMEWKEPNVESARLEDLINKTNVTAEQGLKRSEEALEKLGFIMDDFDSLRGGTVAVEDRLGAVESMFRQDADRRSTFARGVSSGSAFEKRKSCFAIIPNNFRTANKAGDGYDTSAVKQEKMTTVLVGLVTLVLAAILVQHYWPMRFFQQNNMAEPTFKQYLNIYTENGESLFGDPTCNCLHHTIVRDQELGGFLNMSDITAPMDSWCEQLLRESESIASTGEEMFAGLTPLPVPGSSADANGIRPWVWSCPGLDQLNGLVSHLPNESNSTVGWSDCAVVQVLSRQAAHSALQLCKTAENVHKESLVNFGEGYQLSLFMETEAFMARHVEVELHTMAVRNREMFAASGSLLSATARYLDAGDGALSYYDESFGNEHLAFTCPFFQLGAPSAHHASPLTTVVLACNASGVWTGRCCMDMHYTNCQEWLTMPCNEEMRILGAGANASVFHSFTESYFHAFLHGLTHETVVTLQERLALSEEEYFDHYGHGATLDVGFVWTFYMDPLFKAYFEACKPSVCEYWTRREHLEGLVLVVFGLLGGLATGSRYGGLLLLAVWRKTVQKKRKLVRRLSASLGTASQVPPSGAQPAGTVQSCSWPGSPTDSQASLAFPVASPNAPA